MPNNSHNADYNSNPTSDPFVPIVTSLMHVPTISLKSLPINNGIVLSHILNSTDKSPLTDKDANQEFVHKASQSGFIGSVLSLNQPISENRYAHSATAPPVVA